MGARTTGGALPDLFLRLPPREDGTVLRAQCSLVRVRQGGFMIAAPDCEEVVHFLQEQELELDGGGEATVFHLAETEMETSRGRLLGTTAVLLADVCWELVDLFIRAHSLRSSQAFELIKFTLDGQACRPRRSSLLASAEAWINEAMDEDTAGDYATADDQADVGGLPVQLDHQEEQPVETLSELELLRRRVAELEMQAQSPTPGRASSYTPGFSKVDNLDPGSRRGVLRSGATPPKASEQALLRLQQLAGGVPSRLGAHERVLRVPTGTSPGSIAAGRGLGSHNRTGARGRPEGVGGGSAGSHAAHDGPLVLQMKQLQLLTRQTQQKSYDPIHQALGGSSSTEAGSSGGGIKGCFAREAYVKVVGDLERLGEVVQKNASEELGLDVTQPHPSLMRDYIEKRTPPLASTAF